ncbi:hypothetical protein EsH8_VII_000077 [Colletotrichum jinshuiense]
MVWVPSLRMPTLTTLRARQLLPILCIISALSLVIFFTQSKFEYTVITSGTHDSNATDAIHNSTATDAIHDSNPTDANNDGFATDDTPPTPETTSPNPVVKPKYKPQPTWTPPPVKDPFPLLSMGNPPPVPSWNIPKEPNVYHKYNLSVAPPLLVGFTRSWPMLLQTVVSYVTAGWPAEQIYVVENTGVHDANAQGRLSLQNPFYLNYTQLHMLGVRTIRTPVLLSFAQLQNYFVTVAKDESWPYFFWSHMDSFVLSYEEGMEGISGPVGTPEYQTIYELAIKELNHTIHSDDRWGARFFAYDHLALVNPYAYDDIGGFDTFIPYYMTDCDMHWRLEEAGWSTKEAKAGIVEDVASVLDDLRVFYREDEGDVLEGLGFTDPNPPPPPPYVARDNADEIEQRGNTQPSQGETMNTRGSAVVGSAQHATNVASALGSFKRLLQISHDMLKHKQGDRGRNTWQLGQRGGDTREPHYYDALGFQVGIDVMTEAGRETFRRKWGHQGCDFGAAGLKPSDAWKVEKDWE